LKYVELHSASAFSFLEGASRPEDLVSRAKELEMPAIALVDRDGVYGFRDSHGGKVRGHSRARRSRDFRRRVWKPSRFAFVDAEFFLVATGAMPLLVENRTGYQNLCRLMTRYKLREKGKGTGTATLEEIADTRKDWCV